MTELRDVVATALRVTPAELRDDASMESVETWDSLAHMDLIADLERVYDIELSADDIVAMTSLEQIRTVLSRLGRGE